MKAYRFMIGLGVMWISTTVAHFDPVHWIIVPVVASIASGVLICIFDL